ncbi:MAG: hypothetical protein Q9213_007947 [Squamulea squamosa]
MDRSFTRFPIRVFTSIPTMYIVGSDGSLSPNRLFTALNRSNIKSPIFHFRLCKRRQWPQPHYESYATSAGYACVARVNNREYQTDTTYGSDLLARENAAMRAYLICRNFSVNDVLTVAHAAVKATPFIVPSPGKHTLTRTSLVRAANRDPRSSRVSLFSCSARNEVEGRLTGGSKEPSQKGDDAQETDINEAIAQEKEKQTRAPWHREGSNTPPVARQRSAGAMTKGMYL